MFIVIKEHVGSCMAHVFVFRQYESVSSVQRSKLCEVILLWKIVGDGLWIDITQMISSKYTSNTKLCRTLQYLTPKLQAIWQKESVKKKAHWDIVPCQEISTLGAQTSDTLVTHWAMCPRASSTKGAAQVILHMLLSCFFNTCTLCLCHPTLLSDINLWHTDKLVRVSFYRATASDCL